MYLLLSLALLILVVYIKYIRINTYWKSKDVPYLKSWPFFGNMLENFFGTRPLAYIIQDMYEKFPDERYFGFYHYSKPVIMVRDPDLIKQICVKDTDIFPDRPPFLPENVDPFFNKSLLVLKGKAWQHMRSTLSPTFTSSKLRTLFALMVECSQQFIEYFSEKHTDKSVNIKDAFTRFTNDVAASLALGVKCDSMKHKDNEIYCLTKKSLDSQSFIKFFGAAISPTLMKFFNVTFFDKTLRTFLSGIIQHTIKVREQQNIVRQDMLHLLMEARKKQLQNICYTQENVTDVKTNVLDKEELIVQAILFFTAGFDTSANLMCILAYELAVNMDVQERLRSEIDNTVKDCCGNLSYEALMDMKYLDMVVSETLRLWPVTTVSDRLSINPYSMKLSDDKERSVTLDAGTYVWFPLYSLHRDARHFKNPSKFDPERFSNENRSKIRPFTYIPFGAGARNCIASRFVLLETKVIIFYILSQFEIHPVKETSVPFVLSKTNVNLVSEGDLMLELKLREQFL